MPPPKLYWLVFVVLTFVVKIKNLRFSIFTTKVLLEVSILIQSMLRISLVFHTIVPLIDLNNVN